MVTEIGWANFDIWGLVKGRRPKPVGLISQVENKEVMVFTLDGVSNSEIIGNRMVNEYEVWSWNPVVIYVGTC